MGFVIVKRKSWHQNKSVYVLRDTRTGYYKQIAFGERAEFSTEAQAKRYLNEVRQSLKEPVMML
jgi:hypothetical protein